MSTDFAPLFEKKFHDKVVPGLLMVLDDNTVPRVQAHAGAALVNFSEACPKNILTQYLDAIMSKLESVLCTKFEEVSQVVLWTTKQHKLSAWKPVFSLRVYNFSCSLWRRAQHLS
jgi:hypothetical protein